MRKAKILCTFLSLLMLLGSCASILNGKIQKVYVETNNAKSKVFVNDELQGSGKNVESNFKRDLSVQQIKITTDGFKDQYMVNYQTTKSPWYIMTWIPFAVLLYPPFYDIGPKSYDYKKEFVSNEKLIPISRKSDTEKYIFVKNTEFKIDSKDLKFTKINYNSYVKNKTNKAKELDSNTKEIKFDNSIFTNSLNKTLVKYAYTDTTSTIYKNKTNSAYINASITKLNLQSIDHKTFFGRHYFLKVEAEITWDFLDVYGQTIYTKKTTTKSGDFSFNFYKDEIANIAIEDAISNSFLNFMNEKTVKDNMKKSKIADEPKLKSLELFKGAFVENLDDALNSTVTIKVKNGHGSGFKVGKDGYLITNYHVIANSQNKITIITKDNKEYEGKLIRKNESLDLALIKVDATFDKHFEISKENTVNSGDDIFVIGTPKTIELGQTISKGIISGYRENEGIKLLQTDASINGGNSGGPMITKTGKLLGIVNAKFSGIGIEGIGFAIPAEFLTSSLNIK